MRVRPGAAEAEQRKLVQVGLKSSFSAPSLFLFKSYRAVQFQPWWMFVVRFAILLLKL